MSSSGASVSRARRKVASGSGSGPDAPANPFRAFRAFLPFLPFLYFLNVYSALQ